MAPASRVQYCTVVYLVGMPCRQSGSWEKNGCLDRPVRSWVLCSPCSVAHATLIHPVVPVIIYPRHPLPAVRFLFGSKIRRYLARMHEKQQGTGRAKSSPGQTRFLLSLLHRTKKVRRCAFREVPGWVGCVAHPMVAKWGRQTTWSSCASGWRHGYEWPL